MVVAYFFLGHPVCERITGIKVTRLKKTCGIENAREIRQENRHVQVVTKDTDSKEEETGLYLLGEGQGFGPPCLKCLTPTNIHTSLPCLPLQIQTLALQATIGYSYPTVVRYP